MILVDFSGVMWSGLHGASYSMGKDLDEKYFKHMIINMIRSYNVKFKNQYGDLVLCMDGRNYWRKEIHPHYKASRKKARDKSKLDMSEIFSWVDSLKIDLIENFPYKVIEVDRAEADDIMALLARRYCMSEKVLIISSDHDMMQLQRYKNVEQYCPKKKQKLKKDDPLKYLKTHIASGDASDGIPNLFSDLDTFVVDKKRQTPVKKKDLERWSTMSKEDFCQETGVSLERYELNETLVDLTKTPVDIMKNIVYNYDNYVTPNRKKLMRYFMKNKMKIMFDSIRDF